MKESPIDPRCCPLCGKSNACGAAAGEKHCWCFSQPVSQEVLHRLPAKARGVACVCHACATSQKTLEAALERVAKALPQG